MKPLLERRFDGMYTIGEPLRPRAVLKVILRGNDKGTRDINTYRKSRIPYFSCLVSTPVRRALILITRKYVQQKVG